MADDQGIEISFLKLKIEELESIIRRIQSERLNDMINVRVMLEEGSEDEALEYLTALTKD